MKGEDGLEKEYNVTSEMLAHFVELNRKKKELEAEIEEMKKVFNDYFDKTVGVLKKGEVILKDYKLQRQIRKIEKYEQKTTVQRLEQLQLNELIEKRPDEKKIKSAIELGLLSEEELADCKKVVTSVAIYVKENNS